MTNDQAAMTNEEGFEQRNGVDQWDLVIAAFAFTYSFVP